MNPSPIPAAAPFTRYLLSDIADNSIHVRSLSLASLNNQPTFLDRVDEKAIPAMVAHSCPEYGPVCSDFVTHGCILRYLADHNLDFALHLSAGARQDIVLELVLLLVSGSSFSARILARLAEAEASEPDVWLRDDIRIAWIAVLNCANGRPTPWEWAFNTVIGGHPSKVIPELVARAQKHLAMDLPPKKAAASERTTPATRKRKTL